MHARLKYFQIPHFAGVARRKSGKDGTQLSGAGRIIPEMRRKDTGSCIDLQKTPGCFVSESSPRIRPRETRIDLLGARPEVSPAFDEMARGGPLGSAAGV